jgi:hypothetical protein
MDSKAECQAMRDLLLRMKGWTSELRVALRQRDASPRHTNLSNIAASSKGD